tara:strand:- start:886 stop:2124 length:1239 start_codon:yes stop_codon:yes gene_type:complete
MKVFKFGGVSIQSSTAIRNVVDIIKKSNFTDLIIVVSAMGKTTNSLEEIVDQFFFNKRLSLEKIKNFHLAIVDDLFEENHSIYADLNALFLELEWLLNDKPIRSYDYYYDQIVSFGELFSSKIISEYLNFLKIKNNLIDARDIIRTDNSFRNAQINWEVTKKLILKKIDNNSILITQGFIGCTSENFTTTLGREGSDFTAALIANVVKSNELVIWKDVPGILSSDPRFFKKSIKIDRLSYNEAIELAYYGAKVIHPKTIQPLKEKNIPLIVRSFKDVSLKGTIVSSNSEISPLLPFYILKENQVLISISAQDLSFIIEDSLSHIFSLFSKYNVKVNLMQNSAVSFSVCVDYDKHKLTKLIEELKINYKVLFNYDLLLYTIRHYDQKSIDEIIKNNTLFLEQKSRNTIQLVVD